MDNLLLVTAPEKNIVNASIALPASKSISNRVLIIRTMCDQDFSISNLSEAEDTRIIDRALKSIGFQQEIDADHSGTVMRFLTAYLATQPGCFFLTGSNRMKERPIGPLVKALQEIGADIKYLGKPGYPPLKIKGGTLTGGSIEIDSGTSSQFISSLLLIAPTMQNSLKLILSGNPVSSSYIVMTLEIMNYFGIDTKWEGNVISVKPGAYQARDITIEADWSGASYFFEALLLANSGEICFPGLFNEGFQGDAVIWEWFEHLGLKTEFSEIGAIVKKIGDTPEFVSLDFRENPDLAQTMAMALAGSGIKAKFKGLETLPFKETDRIKALQTELGKIGYILESLGYGVWQLGKAKKIPLQQPLSFKTYGDHRMAMACAPLALVAGQVRIEDPAVVVKSFPGYWQCLKSAGFKLEQSE